jgi:hypothetical protein
VGSSHKEYYLYKAQEGIYQKFADKDAQYVKRIISLLDEANQKMPQRTLSGTPQPTKEE